MKGHRCNQTYCSKCHRDRVREARAKGYRDGLVDGLGAAQDCWFMPAKQRKPEIDRMLAHAQATGTLPGEAAGAG